MLTAFDKAIVAAIMAGLVVIEQVWGWGSGITEEYVTVVIAALSPILVWLVPNRE